MTAADWQAKYPLLSMDGEPTRVTGLHAGREAALDDPELELD
jgi:hypothetical protein